MRPLHFGDRVDVKGQALVLLVGLIPLLLETTDDLLPLRISHQPHPLLHLPSRLSELVSECASL